MRAFVVALLLILVQDAVALEQFLIPVASGPIHLGDQEINGWAPIHPGRYSFQSSFSLASSVTNVFLSMEVFEVDYDDNIYVNGVRIGGLCKNPRRSWSECVVPVPDNLFRVGVNTFSVRSESEGRNLDDFQIRNVAISIPKKYVNPRPFLLLNVHNKSFILGNDITIDVIIANFIGNDAINLDVRGQLPYGLDVVSGSTNFSLEILETGNVHIEKLVVRPTEPGKYIIQPHRLSYMDWRGVSFSNTSNTLYFTVIPQPPEVFITRESPREFSVGEEVIMNVTVWNTGTSPIYDVTVVDYLPQEFTVLTGESQASYQMIEPMGRRTLRYAAVADSPVTVSADTVVIYFDSIGIKYTNSAGHALIKVNDKFAGTSLSINVGLFIALISLLVLGASFILFLIKLNEYMNKQM